MSFFVRAVCCDQGCYPEGNCCDGVGVGYVGCEYIGHEFECPQNDAIEGKVLGECLNCLCSNTLTCWWDKDSSLCGGGYVCLADNDTGLPETSNCVNEGCYECNNCNDLPGGCDMAKCHNCYTGQCYYDPHLIGADCYPCANADECSDFNDDPNACNREIGVCDQLSCYWRFEQDDCLGCGGTTVCEDYTDINTCELNPCPGTEECLWDSKNGLCFTMPPGFCDHDNNADRGEACDGIDKRGKTCYDFGLGSGTLGCVNCEYNFTYCEYYDPNEPPIGKCGDGTADDEELCDCEGKKVCTEEQLKGYDCSDFGDFNGGVLSCYDDCSFDTRGCSVCDQDGIRELGEVCDCGFGNCNTEQLNYKGCSDFDFTSGALRCDQNCEYDFSDCVGYDPRKPIDGGTCGDGTRDDAIEACDSNNFGGKTCSDFDYFNSGELKCTDRCEFDTRECELPDADEDPVVCELKNEGSQGECINTGDYWCWDSIIAGGECCGDDENINDKWIDIENRSCCLDSSGNWVFQTDADYSSCFCNLLGDPEYGGTGNAGFCDNTDETFCWSSAVARCCGDDTDEKWSYSTSYDLDKVLVKETCYDSTWKKITPLDVVFYDLSANLI